MSVETLIRKALDKGVELYLVDGQIRYKGKRDAVDELLGPLRQHKADLLRWLQALANDPVPVDPGAWKALAQEYHAHHFACPTCISAGQGRGLRCGTGAALWSTYCAAS
jgi:hypothetical protein